MLNIYTLIPALVQSGHAIQYLNRKSHAHGDGIDVIWKVIGELVPVMLHIVTDIKRQPSQQLEIQERLCRYAGIRYLVIV